MPVLLRLADDGSSRVDAVLELPETDGVIGRGAGADVPLIDESVSREHARIFLAGERWAALSLSDQNPIKVAGRAVERLDLDPGTEFTLGRVRLRFEAQDPRGKATVVERDDPEATEVIAQVKAARERGSTPAADPTNRNPFLNPHAARPSEVASAASPAAASERATSSPGPTPAPAVVESSTPAPATHVQLEAPSADLSGPANRPPTALAGARAWPKVLVALVVLAGVAAAVFHRPLLDAVGVGDSGAEPADEDEGLNDDDSALEVTDPSGALAGWRPTGPMDCEAVAVDATGDSALAKALSNKGRPTGFSFERGAGGATKLVLDYAANAEQLVFVDGAQTERNKRAVDPDAPALPGDFMIGGLGPNTDPRCVVEAFGPALARLDTPAVPIEDASGAVPIEWALSDGASMVTVGPELWRVRVNVGQPVTAADHTVWVGVLRAKYDKTGPRPLVLVDEGPGERRSIALRAPPSAEGVPSLSWKHPRREAPMDLVFEPGDEVSATLDDERSEEAPTYLHAKLGLIDLADSGVQVRPFEISFEHGGRKHEFTGDLVRTPWRAETSASH